MLNICVAINSNLKCNYEFYLNSQNDNNIETMQHLLFSCRIQNNIFLKYLSQQTLEWQALYVPRQVVRYKHSNTQI